MPPPRIRFRKIAWLFVLGFGAQIVIFLIFRAFGASNTATAMASIAANALCWIAGYEWFSFDSDWGGLSSRFRTVPTKVLVVSAACPFALMLLLAATFEMLTRFGVQMQEIPAPSYLSAAPFDLPLEMLVVVLVGPFAEELMFRGLLLDWLRQTMPLWAAVLFGALVFGLLHGISLRSGAAGWAQFGYRVILGVVASLLVLRSKSLLPSFIMHATNNGIMLAVAAVVLKHS